MELKQKNSWLLKAKTVKNDEFYTRYEDIAEELVHYAPHFKDKVVYCNCDDIYVSQFARYFLDNFRALQLKKLIVTGFPLKVGKDNRCACAVGAEIKDVPEHEGQLDVDKLFHRKGNKKIILSGDEQYQAGDFRSRQSVAYLEEADIVVSNPPFSLFSKYMELLIERDKKMLVIGGLTGITLQHIFQKIKKNELWFGVRSFSKHFTFVSTNEPSNGDVAYTDINAIWYTNIDHGVEKPFFELSATFSEEKYPKYENYDAIEVGKTKDIPGDYPGVMGVPISFFNRYRPDQFEILGSNCGVKQDSTGYFGRKSLINGRSTFKRIFVRNRNIRNTG